MTFAEKLRELRDGKGLSEARLSELSGLPFGTVHNYSLGLRKPSLAAAVKLAKALGVDCTAFAGCEDVAGEGEEPEPEKPARKGKK
jgi:transcriptional regulator with XRE-family HTH domain